MLTTALSFFAAKTADKAATKAADVQADAATGAAEMNLEAARTQANAILQAARESNTLQEMQYLLGRQDLAPWREVGGEALMTLKDLMQPEGYLAEGYPEFTGQMGFKPEDVAMDPGFDFRMQEGMKALERSAAARGSLLSGATLKAIERYGQDYSSQEYSNAYNRTYGESLDRYNQALERYRTNFGVDQANRGNLFNRLSSLAGTGQTATAQTADLGAGYATGVGRTMTDAAGNAANIMTGGARSAADALQSAAAARASGYVGSANVWNSAIGNLSQLPMSLYSLLNLR